MVDWEPIDEPRGDAGRPSRGRRSTGHRDPAQPRVDGPAGRGRKRSSRSTRSSTRAAIRRDYAPAWIDLGSHAGKLYGIFYKVTSKATVWYDPKAFAAAGYAVPATWDEMIALADRIVADGRTPVLDRGRAGSRERMGAHRLDLGDRPERLRRRISTTGGSPARSRGPSRASAARSSAFSGSSRRRGYVLGGSDRIVATGDDVGADPLYTEPPTAYLYPFASFAQAFIAGELPRPRAGARLRRLPVPRPSIPATTAAVTVGADVPVLVRDTPAARSFMAYLASARAQEAWIKLGGFTSVNRERVIRRLPGSGRPPRGRGAGRRPPSPGSVPGT